MRWIAQLVADFRGGMVFPVLMKEMRSRMRGGRGNNLLFIAAGLSTVIGLFVMIPMWYDVTGNYATSGYVAQRFAEIGKVLFITLSISNALLCALMAPGLTAGAIAVERERETLELLLLTRLSSANIVLGKLFSALSFLVIVLICSLPVMAIGFVFGGIDPAQLCWSLLLIIATAALFATIGLFCSVKNPKLSMCTGQAYGISLLSLIFVFLGEGGFMLSTDQSFPELTSLMVSAAVMGLMAILPVMAISVLVAQIRRRPLTLLQNGLLWGASAAALWGAAYPNDTAVKHLIEKSYFHIGNPIWALAHIFVGTDMNMPAMLEKWFSPLSVLMLAFWAVIFGMMSVQQLEKMRALHDTAKAPAKTSKPPVTPPLDVPQGVG